MAITRVLNFLFTALVFATVTSTFAVTPTDATSVAVTAVYGDGDDMVRSIMIQPRTAVRSRMLRAGANGDAEATVAVAETTASRKVNDARIALETTTPAATTPAVHSTTSSTSSSSTAGSSTSGKSEPPPVITSVLMTNLARMSFRRQRCLNVDMSRQRWSRNALVFWNVDSSNENTGVGKARGVQCKEVLFFDKSNCKGAARDTIPNPAMAQAGVAFPSTKMTISSWASAASLLCIPYEQQKVNSSDPACAALGCGPDGTCVVDQQFKDLYCQWASPCGACPSGATCKILPGEDDGAVEGPYCACPKGYGITPTKCVKGRASTVSSTSITIIANRTASDFNSRPYTFRAGIKSCIRFPAALVGKFTTMYGVNNIGDAPKCTNLKHYQADNCVGDIVNEESLKATPKLFASYSL
ncbi:unnamed protein product, partial [Closterium sp. Naga37s-1]